MKNTEKLKNYLVDKDDAYLLNKNNNGNVIMISGKWGSGKTHFWQNEIETSLKKEQKNKKKAYSYVSLYGKTNIESIEMDLFMNAYNSVIGDADIVSKMCSTSLSYGKKMGSIFSTVVTAVTAGAVKFDSGKVFKEVENLIDDDKFTKAGEFLNDGGVVCFDDFERKSKEIDLNDLFGFITQLTLNFKCKVVIILNSDVFEGKEKEIFTTVKEKTVSKYLMFNPTCEELFDMIFKEEKYKSLKNDSETRDEEKIEIVLKNTFCKVGIVNARILIQVLDNVLEWYSKHRVCTPFYLEYFILVNINFILNHHIFVATLDKEDISKTFQYKFGEIERHESNYKDATNSRIKSDVEYLSTEIMAYISDSKMIYNQKVIENLKTEALLYEKNNGTKFKEADYGTILLDFINSNESLIKSLHFMNYFNIDIHRESNNQAEVDILNEINNFIETGIL